ncbi:cysteine and histidine-rich protein 1 homolog [Drosophila pseudoobscura]|uniref:Cysteine and histidine-rich protein 1 homolog n=1 Tax=Drosophila pseudoobscura pseudoobscura TaxID=46245 RepID=A0A6I8W1W8_DROPS|nr:cysteine and histidine-rich protein 1 homolog [Drosophila pseudoobscura]
MSNANPNDSDSDNEQPPAAKRQRLNDTLNEISTTVDSSEGEVGGSLGGGVSDLRERLHNLLVCVVCRELPQPHDFYQCRHGHIICDDCRSAVLAVAIFNDTDACCPVCRSCITNHDQKPNLLVRQTLVELPISCPNCNDQFPDGKDLSSHLEFVCEGRVVCCKYHCLGCPWKGPHRDSVAHDSDCGFPQLQGKEILDILLNVENKELEAQKPVLQLHRVLSASHMEFFTLRMNWIHRSEGSHLRTLESESIRAFEENWVLRLRLKRVGEKITVSCQLLLLNTPRVSLMVDYLIQTPQSVCSTKQLHDIHPRIYRHIFDANSKSAKRQELPLAGRQALYRLFAMSRIQLRLWMFLHF